MKIKKHLLPFVSPDKDRAWRLLVASGEEREFKTLAPSERLTALFVLAHDTDKAVAEAASRTLEALGEDFVLKALKDRLDPAVLRHLFSRFGSKEAVTAAIAANEGIDEKLSREIRAPLPVQGGEGQKEAGGPADATEVRHQSTYQTICNMTAGEKIKLAHTGDKTIRGILIKDKNKVVATAVLKNPKLTEQEVVATVSSTSVPEEIIREVARSRQWMKSYNVKCAMVFNPHTPLAFSLKLVDYLRERDLKQLAKSKGVPRALVNAAVRRLRLRNRQ